MDDLQTVRADNRKPWEEPEVVPRAKRCRLMRKAAGLAALPVVFSDRWACLPAPVEHIVCEATLLGPHLILGYEGG